MQVICWRAPAEVEPLEVRFAHPVRLSPATHSQGHGRPCLQRLHLRRGFSHHRVFPDVFFRDRCLPPPNLGPPSDGVAGRGHAAVSQGVDLQGVIKTGRGNVAKKWLRFHALVKLLSDYQ